jgi:hemolysin type calcium-binding protein
MDHHHQQKQKQKQFSIKSRLPAAALAIFTGLIVLLMMPSAPVLVFAANIDGTPGDDILNGTPEADTINGFEGYDKLFGEGGDDTLDGGTGEDEIHGGDGNDEIKDESGDPEGPDRSNKVYGGSGNDNIDLGIDGTYHPHSYYVYGEDGADYIEVVSNAIIEGGPDDDIIYCTAPTECPINGNEGDDEIHAQFDQESAIHGGSGNDELYVRSGDSSLVGDEGNDYLFQDGSASGLHGSEGDDVLEATGVDNDYNGGLGADTFKCGPGPDDEVQDYHPEEGDIVSEDCEIVKDITIEPVVEITQAVDKKGVEVSDGGTTTNSKYIKITFEVTEGNQGLDKIGCSLDGQAFTSCTSPVVYDKLKKGTHEVTVRAWDFIGRFGEDEFTWTIGNTPPPPRR